MLAFAELHPRLGSPRNTPLSAILLTNADLDHVLGLFALREGGPVTIYATDSVRRVLTDDLGLERVLERFCGVVWHDPLAEKNFALNGDHSLQCRAISLPGGSVAYLMIDQRTGARVLAAPDVAEINDPLREAINDSIALFFDGTFWSADELRQTKPGARTAAQMGHIPISDGSLDVLAQSSARHKVYIHINNTNPILAASSPERMAVEKAGIIVGFDGLEFEI